MLWSRDQNLKLSLEFKLLNSLVGYTGPVVLTLQGAPESLGRHVDSHTVSSTAWPGPALRTTDDPEGTGGEESDLGAGG